MEFNGWDDDVLEVRLDDAWIGRDFYKPGDHKGCMCISAPDAAPIGAIAAGRWKQDTAWHDRWPHEVRYDYGNQMLVVPADIEPAHLRALQQAIKPLANAYPDVYVRWTVAHQRLGGWALTYPHRVVEIDRRIFAEGSLFRRRVAEGWFVPSGAGKKPIDYVAVHEFGHVLGQTQPFTLRIASIPSTYGQTAPNEAFAEAFTEWWFSKGTTDNEDIRAMAQVLEWKHL